MLSITKTYAHETVDFAAAELKKYLRMMMPKAGDVKIAYDPEAKEGFRLGLMQDFGLDVSDVKNTELDDILYIDTDEEGGVIAGDNPRSVLLAVYEYLRQNGCRWLFPGVDGEYVPMKEIAPVKVRHVPSCRYRGHCIEGACTQEVLLHFLDFLPKVGMNVFQMQFLVPTVFYKRAYNHDSNPQRSPEPVSDETMLQWKMACEAEMAKRGIQFHDVGHGWTVAPFGISTSSGWERIDDSAVPDTARPFLAKLGGERRLFQGITLNTQFCMSSPEARRAVAEYIAEYTEIHRNVDYIHVWLGDGHNNHCECEECVTKSVSDWYVMLLNEIDRALTAKNLQNRVVFIQYNESIWPPATERIENPDRFAMMIAPISRSYTRTLTDKAPTLYPFTRNAIRCPADLDAFLAYYRQWRQVWDGAAFCFDYHFWVHQIFDPSGLFLAKRIYEDVKAYKENGIDGIVACGSQRSFFPTGFAYYVFARRQFDLSLPFEELTREYFTCAFGEAAPAILEYLRGVGDCFGDRYLEGEESADPSVSRFYNPERAKKLAAIGETLEKGRAAVGAHYNSSVRIQTVSVRLVEQHIEYCRMIARLCALRADGKIEEAKAAYAELLDTMSSREWLLETYFDHHLAMPRFDYLTNA